MNRDVCEHFNPIELPCDKCDEKRKSEALFLADELEIPLGTVVGSEVHRRAAAELRRLHAENETLKRSVALLQQHHATAWNRGHMMGMKTNRDTARRALDAVKQDAWGNTQLTEALLKAEDQRDALLEALKTVEWHGGGSCWVVDADKIAAAIAKAEENT